MASVATGVSLDHISSVCTALKAAPIQLKQVFESFLKKPFNLVFAQSGGEGRVTAHGENKAVGG